MLQHRGLDPERADAKSIAQRSERFRGRRVLGVGHSGAGENGRARFCREAVRKALWSPEMKGGGRLSTLFATPRLHVWSRGGCRWGSTWCGLAPPTPSRGRWSTLVLWLNLPDVSGSERGRSNLKRKASDRSARPIRVGGSIWPRAREAV